MSNSSVERDLKTLFGLPPYDEPSNYLRGDGYFAQSLERKYGKTIDELCRETGIKRPTR